MSVMANCLPFVLKAKQIFQKFTELVIVCINVVATILMVFYKSSTNSQQMCQVYKVNLSFLKSKKKNALSQLIHFFTI